jgi:hypothetical protein
MIRVPLPRITVGIAMCLFVHTVYITTLTHIIVPLKQTHYHVLNIIQN